MTAVIVYTIEYMSWGEDDERTGWFLQRITVVTQAGKPKEIIDRKPIAKFVGEFSAEATTFALSFSRALQDKSCIVLPHEWKFDDLEEAMKG